MEVGVVREAISISRFYGGVMGVGNVSVQGYRNGLELLGRLVGLKVCWQFSGLG